MSKTKLPTLDEARAERDAAEAAYGTACQERERAQDAAYAAAKRLRLAKKAVTEAVEREARNRIARDRNKAKKLARQYGVTIEWDAYSGVPGDGVFWVLGPKAVYGDGDGCEADGQTGPVRADPCEGDHTCIDWSSVLNNVEEYVTDMQKLGAERAQALLATA